METCGDWRRRRRLVFFGSAALLMVLFFLLGKVYPGYSRLKAPPTEYYSVVTLRSVDDLNDLARRYNTTVKEIIRDNFQNGPIKNGCTLTIRENTVPKKQSRGNDNSWNWPLIGPVTSDYGGRSGEFHHGLDIGVYSGTAVHAARTGWVAKTGWLGVYGLTVLIDHGNGVQTLYAHNSELLVSAGDSVEAGQIIAYSGDTGNSTGPHLHFEIRFDGLTVDPNDFLPHTQLANQ